MFPEVVEVGAVLGVPQGGWPWSVEMRSRSVHLHAVGLGDGFPAVRQAVPAGEVAVTLERSWLWPLVVACSAVLAHPSMARRQRGDGSWSSTCVGSRFAVLRGPAWVVFTDELVEVAGMASTVQVEHEHVAGLRVAALEQADRVAPSRAPSPR